MGYILSIVADATDHLAKIAAKEMAITEMISRNPTVFSFFLIWVQYTFSYDYDTVETRLIPNKITGNSIPMK